MTKLLIEGKELDLDDGFIRKIEHKVLKAFISDVEARCPELIDWQWWEKLKTKHLNRY